MIIRGRFTLEKIIFIFILVLICLTSATLTFGVKCVRKSLPSPFSLLVFHEPMGSGLWNTLWQHLLRQPSRLRPLVQAAESVDQSFARLWEKCINILSLWLSLSLSYSLSLSLALSLTLSFSSHSLLSHVLNYHASRLTSFYVKCCFELSRVSTDETSVLEGRNAAEPRRNASSQ